MSVYFLQRGVNGPIKIGYSKDRDGCFKRMQDAQPYCAETLYMRRIIVDGDMAEERRLHREFAAFRLEGEWFSPAFEVAREADAVPTDLEAAYGAGYRDGFEAISMDVASAARAEVIEIRKVAMAQGRVLHRAFKVADPSTPEYAELWEYAHRNLNPTAWLAKMHPRQRWLESRSPEESRRSLVEELGAALVVGEQGDAA